MSELKNQPNWHLASTYFEPVPISKMINFYYFLKGMECDDDTNCFKVEENVYGKFTKVVITWFIKKTWFGSFFGSINTKSKNTSIMAIYDKNESDAEEKTLDYIKKLRNKYPDRTFPSKLKDLIIRTTHPEYLFN